MFFKKGDRLFLRIGAQKTGNEAIIPVKPIALALLEKYAYKLDFTANQVANRNIKLVASLAGINDMIFQDGKRLPKCKFVTMHTARRSAATNLYLEGLSLKTIGDLGGWKSVSNLMIYLRASGMDSADMAADLDFFN